MLILQGCKTKTAADAPTFVPSEVVDVGDARASGHVSDRIVLVEGETREKREINEDFEIRISSTSPVVPVPEERAAK